MRNFELNAAEHYINTNLQFGGESKYPGRHVQTGLGPSGLHSA